MTSKLDRALTRVRHLLMRVAIVCLLVCASLVMILLAGAVAYDNQAEKWDIQTFALLVGSGTYFIALLGGLRRANAVELAFLGSSAAAIYASLAVPNNRPLLGLLVLGAIYSTSSLLLATGLRWEVRLDRRNSEKKNDLSPNRGEPAEIEPRLHVRAESKKAPVLERSLGQRPSDSFWLIAIIGGAVGALLVLVSERS
jgi:hypothetical protein